MSIRQKRTLTEASVAAHRQNAQKSRGPVTPEGRQTQRDASLRHGFYSKERDTALRALGEDPADFDALVKAVQQKYAPADEFEEAFVMRLARAMWRMERGDRSLEGHALRQAEEANRWREGHIHAQLMKLKMAGASLQSLAQSVAKDHYVTSAEDLTMMKNLLTEESLQEIGDIMLALFLQLQQPGAHDGQGQPVDPYEKSRRALQKFKEIFGLAGDAPPVVRRPSLPGQEPLNERMQPGTSEAPPNPPEVKKPALPVELQGPQLSPEEWAKREPVRQLLENLLARQADLCEAERTNLLRRCLTGPSSFERAAEIAPTQPSALLMQRMQDSAFREVWRISNLLLKLQRQAPGGNSVSRHPGSGNGRDGSSRSFSPDSETPPPRAQEDVAPTLRSEPADAMASPAASAIASPTTRVAIASRETIGTTSRTRDFRDVRKVTRSVEHLSYSQPRTNCRLRIRSSSCQRGQKKDVKMKVYPEKSNRINNALDARRPADLRGALPHGQDDRGAVGGTGTPACAFRPAQPGVAVSPDARRRHTCPTTRCLNGPMIQ